MTNLLSESRKAVATLYERAESDPNVYAKADEKRADLNEDIARLAEQIAAVCGEALVDKGASFTCREATLIDELLQGFDSPFADDFRRTHSAEDIDDGDEHGDGWEA